MIKVLDLVSLRFLRKHPLQSLLSIIGIAIGVAVLVSIDVANQSSSRAFEMSMDMVAGRSTHYITGINGMMPDTVYRKIRIELGIDNAYPLINHYIRIAGKSGEIEKIRLLGIDPVAGGNNSIKLTSGANISFLRLISIRNSIFLDSSYANSAGYQVGDSVDLRIESERKKVYLAGLINTSSGKQEQSFSRAIITDISTAQMLLDEEGNLSSVELEIHGNDAKTIAKIKAILPRNCDIYYSQSRNETSMTMVSAFNSNLAAMSLLALIVGMFLIYNTMTFAVLRRRNQLGLLRAIGTTRREIFILVVTESLILGLIGTILGLVLGVILGRGMVNLVTQSINDLYFVLSVKDIEISWEILLKGILLGLMATLIASLKPAYEAANAPPRTVLLRSAPETSLRRKVLVFALIGLLFAVIGAIVLLIPSNNIFLSYGGILPLIIGFAFITPASILLISRIVKPFAVKVFGVTGAISTRSIITQMSRTSIAISALAIALSAAIGVGTMVASFRTTVIDWLEKRLKADVYISAPNLISRFNDGDIDTNLVHKIRELPGIEFMNLYREIRLQSSEGMVHLIAANFAGDPRKRFTFISGKATNAWDDLLHREKVIMSESFAFRRNMKVGDSLMIPTDYGNKKFAIAAIYRDYGSDMGFVMMELKTYRKNWTDKRLTGIGVFAKKGYDIEKMKNRISSFVKPDEDLIIQTRRLLIDSSIEVFDRTFIITNILQLLAIGVAFIGILSSLMALQLERAREFGVMRALGLTPGRLKFMLAVQTGLMGFIAAILALPLGNILAYVFIFVINKRSFGWSLDYHFQPIQLLQAVVIAVLASLLAGIVPGIKMSKSSPILALREE